MFGKVDTFWTYHLAFVRAILLVPIEIKIIYFSYKTPINQRRPKGGEGPSFEIEHVLFPGLEWLSVDVASWRLSLSY
jgi:hypothetical protein